MLLYECFMYVRICMDVQLDFENNVCAWFRLLMGGEGKASAGVLQAYMRVSNIDIIRYTQYIAHLHTHIYI